MPHGRALGSVLFALSLTRLAAAQTPAPGVDTVAGGDTTRLPGNTLVPLPVLFYMPETGTGLGAVVTYYVYPVAPRTDRLLPSTFTAMAIYTTRKQVVTSLATELYLGAGRYRLLGDVGYSKFRTEVWGIGNDTPNSLQESYTPRTLNLAGEFQWQARTGWYFGGVAQFTYRELAELEEDGLLRRGDVPGAQDGRIVGAGVLVTRDTRDNTVYPTRGGYQHLRALIYDGLLGSDYAFASFSLDLRQYVSIGSGHVVAVRTLGQAAIGSPPFDALFQLGGNMLLRGYYEGRFRDRDLLAFQAEYRAPLWWRIGVVGFVGAGQVAGRPDGFHLGGFKASAGGGLRFQLSRDAGLNVRADYGWAFDVGSGGFYLRIGEAF